MRCMLPVCVAVSAPLWVAWPCRGQEPGSAEFHVEVVDSIRVSGWQVSLQIDAHGKVHVVDGVSLAVQEGAGWRFESIRGVQLPSQPTLTFAWHETPVMTYIEGSMGPSWAATSEATFLEKQVGGWRKVTLSRQWTTATHAATSPSHDYHAVVAANDRYRFEPANKLVYIRLGAKSLEETLVGDGIFSDVAIAVDRWDRPHVVVGNAGAGDPRLEHWFRGESGGWEVERIAGSSQAASAAVDMAGVLHVAYYDTENQTLRYATRHDSVWSTVVVGADGLITSTSLAVDRDGTAHLACIDGSGYSIRYARSRSPYGAWEIIMVDRRRSLDGNVSLAVDQDGEVHIAYTDTWFNDLIYATTRSPVAVSHQSWSKVKSTFR